MRWPQATNKADDRRKPGDPPNKELQAGLSTFDVATLVRERLFYDKDYARLRRNEWRTRASWTRTLTLASSAASTVILGLSDLSRLAQVGFGLTAIVTALSAIEPFFNWRARWVSAEEALSEWHALEEDLSLYVAQTLQSELDLERIIEFDVQRR